MSQFTDAKFDHYNAVKNELALSTSWSIYEVEDLYAEHPFANAKQIVYQDHWGKESVSTDINGNTFAALYVAADNCIGQSQDQHHVFIEHFVPDAPDPTTLYLTTGS